MDEEDGKRLIEDLDNLRHMVGATQPIARAKVGYRNYFYIGAEESSDDFKSMLRLIDLGFVVRVRPDFFKATEKGLRAIGLDGQQRRRALSS